MMLIHEIFLSGEVITHMSLKCILNEGMPQYKNPFEKGKLIIQFIVNFPDTIDEKRIPQLEALLPPRPEIIIPDEADEVCYSKLLNCFVHNSSWSAFLSAHFN